MTGVQTCALPILVCVNREDKTKTILVVSEKGFGKRTFLDDPETGEANYRITNRGGKGVRTINVTDKTGSLVGLLDVSEKEDLMITCVSGVTIRMKVKDVSEQGRATQGVKLIRIDEGDAIAAITKLDEEEVDALEIDGAGNTDLPAADNNEQAGEETEQPVVE